MSATPVREKKKKKKVFVNPIRRKPAMKFTLYTKREWNQMCSGLGSVGLNRKLAKYLFTPKERQGRRQKKGAEKDGVEAGDNEDDE